MQDCDIYLLDDILAAVDVHVAAWLTAHALTGPLLGSKTRIVCSNASLLGLVADQTVRLYKGKVVSLDTPAKVGGGDEAVRGGMSTRGNRLEPSPLGIALGLTGKLLPSSCLHIVRSVVSLSLYAFVVRTCVARDGNMSITEDYRRDTLHPHPLQLGICLMCVHRR